MKKIEGTIEATPEELKNMSEKFTTVIFDIILDRLKEGKGFTK